ncbi:hypothetical protein A7D17_16170 [Xanthomonas floridensis]|uniref:Uncharacterized protein n=1 Tax=Xanthomonas floridensis TaxID=1843580 RepID=A0A1A9MCD1_9XANT|nr:hypothetical protein A7D17_16170 [Xanthomonas floridensis]
MIPAIYNIFKFRDAASRDYISPIFNLIAKLSVRSVEFDHEGNRNPMETMHILIYSIMSNLECLLRTRLSLLKLYSSQSIAELKHLVIEPISQARRNHAFIQKMP